MSFFSFWLNDIDSSSLCLASTYSLTPWRHFRAAAVSLALLAAVLLIVDISLGVHCKSLLLCTVLIGIID